MGDLFEILFRVLTALLVVIAILIGIAIAICIAIIIFICKGLWLSALHFFYPHPDYMESMP